VTDRVGRGRRFSVFLRERAIFFIIFLLLFPALFRPRIYGFDPVGYFSWVRSIVIDGNLDTTNEYLHYGNDAITGATITGHNHNPYAVGAPFIWSPFYLGAHLVETIRAALTNSPPPDGYGTLYVLAVSFASALYGFVAVLILHQLARRLYDVPTARIASLTAWLATPLVFYMYSHPTMAHASDALANALVFAAWFALGLNDRARNWFLLGLSIGLAILVRTQNALLCIIPAAWLLVQLPAAWRTHTQRAWFVKVGAFVIGGLLLASVQMLVWRLVFGKWIELSPYSYTANAGEFTGTLHLFEVLFSTDRGLFIWSPVLIFAVLGVIPLYRQQRRLAIFLAFNFCAQVVVVSAWSVYNGALSFGARLLLQSVPIYFIGLAACVDWLRRRRWSVRRLNWIGAAFIVWNFLLIIQYAVGTVPRTGPFPISQLIVGQFTVIPAQFGRIVQALLTRQ
jgi:hypothetical protein